MPAARRGRPVRPRIPRRPAAAAAWRDMDAAPRGVAGSVLVSAGTRRGGGGGGGRHGRSHRLRTGVGRGDRREDAGMRGGRHARFLVRQAGTVKILPRDL